MLIFRVERCGTGPYKQRWTLGATLHWKHGDDTHPSPCEEDLCDDMLGFHCGFCSIDHLKIWFHGFRKSLNMCGFKMVVYEVSHKFVRIGAIQAIFKKDKANLVKVLKVP